MNDISHGLVSNCLCMSFQLLRIFEMASQFFTKSDGIEAKIKIEHKTVRRSLNTKSTKIGYSKMKSKTISKQKLTSKNSK